MDTDWNNTADITAEDYRKKAREMSEQAASARDDDAARTFRELALQYELLARHNDGNRRGTVMPRGARA